MSTSSSRRLFLKGTAALGIAGALGVGQLALQGAQAATLDIQRVPLDLRVSQAMIDISGFTLSYEVSGLQPIFENGLYTPYFEIGNYTEDKGFKVFYFISLEKNRLDTDNVYRQTVILPTDMTTGPKGKYGIRLTLRPYNKQYTILRTMVSDVAVNTDYARTPFIIDLEDDDPYSYDVYTVCQQKMMLIDKNRRIYPYRAATRGDLMDTLYRTVGSPKVALPAVSPYPDVSPQDPRYAAYIWAVQKGLTSGWSDGKMHPEAVAHRTTMAAFLYRFNEAYPALTEGTHPTPVVPADMHPGSPFFRESVWLHTRANIDPNFAYKSANFFPDQEVTRAEWARALIMLHADTLCANMRD